jgi:hypothetical protein
MLYVPLFFYIFDRWTERSKEKKDKKKVKSGKNASADGNLTKKHLDVIQEEN